MNIIRVTDRKLIIDKYKRENIAINRGYKGHCKAQAAITIKKMAMNQAEPWTRLNSERIIKFP